MASGQNQQWMSGNNAFRMFNVVSGIQDFAIVMQNGGSFERSIMAATNNIGVLIAGLNPLAALGGTLGLITFPALARAMMDVDGGIRVFSNTMDKLGAQASETARANIALEAAIRQANAAHKQSLDLMRSEAEIRKEQAAAKAGTEILAEALDPKQREALKEQFIRTRTEEMVGPQLRHQRLVMNMANARSAMAEKKLQEWLNAPAGVDIFTREPLTNKQRMEVEEERQQVEVLGKKFSMPTPRSFFTNMVTLSAGGHVRRLWRKNLEAQAQAQRTKANRAIEQQQLIYQEAESEAQKEFNERVRSEEGILDIVDKAGLGKQFFPEMERRTIQRGRTEQRRGQLLKRISQAEAQIEQAESQARMHIDPSSRAAAQWEISQLKDSLDRLREALPPPTAGQKLTPEEQNKMMLEVLNDILTQLRNKGI